MMGQKPSVVCLSVDDAEELIDVGIAWESHEPGYFSLALFDHRKWFE